MDPRGAYVAPYLFVYFKGLLQKHGSVDDNNNTGRDCEEAFPAGKKRKRKQYLLLAEKRSVHDGRENLLTLLPPYISLVSLSHVRDGWAHTCPIGARAKQPYLWRCVCGCAEDVWLAVVFVRRTKPHTVDRNCKMLYAFQFAICLVEEGDGVGWGEHFFLALYGEKKRALRRNSKMQDAVEVSNVGANRTRVSLLHFFLPRPWLSFIFFPPLFAFAFHPVCGESRQNWLRQAKAGRQAEGRSIRLVNHFLFSLGTAVDW